MVAGANFRTFSYGTQPRHTQGPAPGGLCVQALRVHGGDRQRVFPGIRAPQPARHDHDARREALDPLQFRPGPFGGRSTIREAIKAFHQSRCRPCDTRNRTRRPGDRITQRGWASPLRFPAGRISGARKSAKSRRSKWLPRSSVFADRGVHVEPLSIARIEDKDGNVLEENSAARQEGPQRTRPAFIMTSMLEGVVNGGTGSRVRDYFQLPARREDRDDYGFLRMHGSWDTPRGIAAAVWVGFDEPSVHFTTWDGQGGRAPPPPYGAAS